MKKDSNRDSYVRLKHVEKAIQTIGEYVADETETGL